jgi:hypothetical protein
MPEMTVEFYVYCDCGEHMCGKTTVKDGGRVPSVVVDPCPRCMERARNDGYDEGYEDGLREGGENAE